MADLTTLIQRLAEAETAKHNLATGSRMERLTSPNGDSVGFTAASMAELDKYINELAIQIAQLQGDPSPKSPVYFRF